MFNVKTLEETYQLFQHIKVPLQTMTIKTIDSLGYITSEDLYSREDVPSFNKSTVDGYACKYEDITLSSEQSPSVLHIVGKIEMGTTSNYTLQSGEAIYVPTGGHVPNGADCMVMIEHTDRLLTEILIYKKTARFQNMILTGQDIKKDTLLIKQFTRITPRVIGALYSQNITSIEVYQPFDFSVISTGDEITNQEIISKGEVRDINTHTISSYIKQRKQNIVFTSIIKDDFESFKKEIIKGFEQSDIVISSGGSSVGEKDYTISILKDLNANILLHGLNIKPGKPTIIASYQEKLFIGLPGHPLSAYIVLHLLLDPLLQNLFHQQVEHPFIEKELSENVHNNTGRTMIQLVAIDNNKAVPLYYKSAMINVLKDAYGYILIDQNKEGFYKNDIVRVYRLGD